MPSFNFKNNRTSKFDINGKRIPNTLNASSKESIYKNINSKFNTICTVGKGCTNAGCGEQCCLLSFLVTGILKSDYKTKNMAGHLRAGNTITSDMGEIGTIDAIIFPEACCQDPSGVILCEDGKECLDKNKNSKYSDIYGEDCDCNYKPINYPYCDETWPLTIRIIVKSTSGSCANPNYNSGNLTINGVYISSQSSDTYLEGYDVIGSSSKGSSYINPILGYRKVLTGASCCTTENNSLVKPGPANNIYKDMHAKYTGKINLLDSGKKSVTKENNVCYSGIIKSGLQPKSDVCTKNCSTGVKCIIKNNYSYDYRQYLHNKSGKSWERSQDKFVPMLDGKKTSLGGVPSGSVQPSEYSKSCLCEGKISLGKTPAAKTIYKPSNRKFSSQGAVSAGSRLERLKLDTVRSTNSKCNTKKCNIITATNGINTKVYVEGNGPYFAGKNRFIGQIYNSKHPETCTSRPRQLPFGIPQLTNKNRSTSNHFRRSFGGNIRGKIGGIWQRKNVC